MAELIGELIETIQSIGSARFDLTGFVVLTIVKVVIAILLKAAGCGGPGVVPIIGVAISLLLRAAGYDHIGFVVLIVKAEIGIMLKVAGYHRAGCVILIVVLIAIVGIVLSNI